MKYKVGDKFLVEITEINDSSYPYTLGEIATIASEENLDKLRRPDDMTAEEAWATAWRLHDMTIAQLQECFGKPDLDCVQNFISHFGPQEAKAKIRVWEAEKDFGIGDVVRAEDSAKAVVLNIHDEYLDVLVEDGCAEEWYKSKVKKTGRHIDIQSMLEQIGGEE